MCHIFLGEQHPSENRVDALPNVTIAQSPQSLLATPKNIPFVMAIVEKSTTHDFTSTVEDHTLAACFPALFLPRDRINRLEISAALNLSINVLPFWVCTFPVTIHAISLYWCIRFGSDCTTMVEIGSYLRDLFLFHSVYNPVMYMTTSAEFRRARHQLAHLSGLLASRADG